MDSDRRYCVYLHKSLDGEVFYVGSGTLERAYTKELSETSGIGTCRGKKYSEKVKELEFKYCVEVVKEGLDKEQSLCIEEELMSKFNASIVNKNKPSRNSDLSKFKDIFYYDVESPSFLSWKIDHYKIKAGDNVKCDKGNGYIRIHYRRKSYVAHRIIVTLFGFDVDGKVVDHIDGNPFNNLIENLRVVSQKENRRNSKIRKDNTSGYSGIKFFENKRHWIFNWHENGRRNTKTFHIRNFNNDKDAALLAAIQFRETKLAEIGYSYTHGK